MQRSGRAVKLLFLFCTLISVTVTNPVFGYDLSFSTTPTVDSSGLFYSMEADTPGTLTITSTVQCLVPLSQTWTTCPDTFTIEHTLQKYNVNVGTKQTLNVNTVPKKGLLGTNWKNGGIVTVKFVQYQKYTITKSKIYSLPTPANGLVSSATYSFYLNIPIPKSATETLPRKANNRSSANFTYTVYSGNVEYGGTIQQDVLNLVTEASSAYCSYQYLPGVTENSGSTAWWNARFTNRDLCAKKIIRNGFTDLLVVTNLGLPYTPAGPSYKYILKGQSTGSYHLSSLKLTATGTLPKTISIDYDLMHGATVVKRIKRSLTPTWHESSTSGYFYAWINYSFTLPPVGNTSSTMQTDAYYFTIKADTGVVAVAKSTSTFPYTIFSRKLDFNNVATTLSSVTYSNTSSGTQYQLDSIGANWPHIMGSTNFSAVNLWTNSSPNADGYSLDLSVSSGTATIGDVTGQTAAGINFTLKNVALVSTGGVYTKALLDLPDSVTGHIEIGGEIWPGGIKTISFPGKTFSAQYNPSPTPFVINNGVAMYFHGHSLPFYIKTGQIDLDLSTDGILKLNNPTAVYVHSSAINELATDDSRRTLGLPSNDIIFAGTGSKPSSAIITGNGINAELSLSGSPGGPMRRTSFPQTIVSFDPWFVMVQDGIITKSDLPSPAISMNFKRDCSDGTCGENGGNAKYNVVSLSAGLLANGAFGGQFNDLGNPVYPIKADGVEWGGYEAGLPTFFRKDLAVPGVWLVPGFIMPGTSNTGENRRISQVLLGSVRFDTAGTPLSFHALNDLHDSTARDGDGFFAGINMGPEMLVGDPASPRVDPGNGSILNGVTKLRFYGNTTFTSMVDRQATKYVLRPGGLTGVFNTSFSAATDGPISIYNYDMYFSRFAFRQDRNNLDGDTFIDGDLTLNGPVGGATGMKVGFRSLDLTCNGNLGGGDVDSEKEANWAANPLCNHKDDDKDGLIDEGCQILDYWQMPILYKGMAFANDPDSDPDSGNCPSQPRKLQLTTANYVDGIKAPLSMQSLYPPDGTLENQTVTGSVDTWFDKPTTGSNPGFNLRLQRAYLNQISTTRPAWKGFMTLAGLTDVPLFNDAKLSGHFANNNPADLLDYDLYMFKDETSSDANFDGVPDAYGSNVTDGYRKRLASAGDDPVKPHFNYSWPSSAMVNLNYYADYSRSFGTDMPQFLGIKKESDILSVVRVNSVPDYINPLRTKFSFGASADLAALKNFQVDLNNLPGGIDTFLQNNLGVDPSFSLGSILGDLVNTEQIMHDLTGGDLTDLFAEIINQALLAPPLDGAITDVANLINEAHQAPYQIVGALIDPLEDAQNKLVQQLTGTLTTSIDNLYNQYAAFVVYNTDQLEVIYNSAYPGAPDTEFTDMRAKVEKIRSDIITTIDILDNTTQKLQSAVAVLGGAQGKIKTTINAIGQAEAAITTMSTFLNSDLGNLLSNNPANNPLLGVLENAKNTVTTVKNQIKAVNLGQVGQALQTAAALSGSTIDTSMLNSAEETINTAVDQLESIINQADTSINNLYATLPLSDLLDQINPLLAPAPTGMIQQNLANLKNALIQVNLVLSTVSSLAENGLTTVSSHLGTIRDALQSQDIASGTLPSWGEVQLKGQFILDNLAVSLVTSLPGGNLEGILGSLKSSGTANFITVFHDSLADILMAPINQVLDDYGANGIRSQLEIIIDQSVGLLPNPTPQDIRNMIRTQIMSSGAIVEINELFYEQFGFVSDMVDEVASKLTSQINSLIRQAVDAVNEGLSQSLAGVTAGIGDDAGWSGIKSVGIDGYALVSQDEIEKIHMEAEFEMDGDPDPTSYNAALDVTLWSAENGKTACAPAGSANYDVTISTHDVKAEMLGLPVGIKTASLGFTMQSSPTITPLSVFGNVYLLGEINFEALILEDLGLESGLGIDAYYDPIIYFGATGAGRFQDYTIPKAAFYLGRTCDFGVLSRLDPEAAEFIGEIVPLTGVYARGSVEVPIYNSGCMFTIGVGADIGVWYFTNPTPGTYGGLVGGSAYGKLACLASLKGKITTIGQKSGSKYKFAGDGWAAAGVGSCSPSKWKKVSDARKDSWCLTGDAQFGAEYDSGWEIDGPKVNCCD